MGDVAPARFAVIEPAGSKVGARLAAIGWTPIAATGTPVGLAASGAIDECEVVVVVCVEHELVSPDVVTEIDRVAAQRPRVAVVIAPGLDAAAEAARHGWRGFVPASSPTSAIARTISLAARGELAFPSSATGALARALARIANPAQSSRALTPRQQQIVALLAEGATDVEIAERLRISRFTAYKHVQNARRRLGARTRGQLVAASQLR